MTSVSLNYHAEQTGSLSLVTRENGALLEQPPGKPLGGLLNAGGQPTPRVSDRMGLAWALECAFLNTQAVLGLLPQGPH